MIPERISFGDIDIYPGEFTKIYISKERFEYLAKQFHINGHITISWKDGMVDLVEAVKDLDMALARLGASMMREEEDEQ